VGNPTHNVPIYLLTTLRGILRVTTEDKHSIYQAFWDGMGRGLMNALFVILLALERHECRLEHNLRSLPDVILHILNHLAFTVKILPSCREAERCLTAIGACGWSRTRSRLAVAWIRTVRLAVSEYASAGAPQSTWKRLQERAAKPDDNYYKKFRVPQRQAPIAYLSFTRLPSAHDSPNNFIALTSDPPDTLGAFDEFHADNQSDLSSASEGEEPSSDEEDVGGTSWCPKYRAARTIQRCYRGRAMKAVAKAVNERPAGSKAKPIPPHTGRFAPVLAGHAKAPYRPNDWVDIAVPHADLYLSKTFAAFKGSHFGSKLNAILATRPRQQPFYNA
jgi:hypothetical protein